MSACRMKAVVIQRSAGRPLLAISRLTVLGNHNRNLAYRDAGGWEPSTASEGDIGTAKQADNSDQRSGNLSRYNRAGFPISAGSPTAVELILAGKGVNSSWRLCVPHGGCILAQGPNAGRTG
jgi:hypothetical protein